MKNRFRPLLMVCFLFFILMLNNCWDPDHKNPLDPDNPDTKGKVEISIIDPVEGQDVTMNYIVRGTVSRIAEIRVLVHPLPTNFHWVQNFPVVQNDGSWQCKCGFGTPDQPPDTVDFEVYAVTAWDKLELGQMLSSVPRNTNISNVVRVTRPE
jgi:hypothetical protein